MSICDYFDHFSGRKWVLHNITYTLWPGQLACYPWSFAGLIGRNNSCWFKALQNGMNPLQPTLAVYAKVALSFSLLPLASRMMHTAWVDLCFDRCHDGREPKIPVVRVVVKAAATKPKYIITLGGTTEMVREERDVSHGTAIFRDLLILAMPAAVKTASARLPCAVFVSG